MSSAEPAASLFGPGDSSSDPFAILGTDLGQEASDPFAEVPTGTSAPSMVANVFDAVGDTQTPLNGTADLGYNHPDTHDQSYAHNAADVYASSYGAYGEQAQRNANQQYYGTNATSNNLYDASKYAPPSKHNPYAPPQASTYVTATSQQVPASNPPHSYHATQQSAYDFNPSDQYAPPPATTQPPYVPYGSYAPQMQAGVPAYDSHMISRSPPYPAPPPTAKASSATVLPPSTMAQITRPKISNAYDPPFPAISYSRRNVSGPARGGAGHTSPAHSAYAAYQNTTPPLPPPPPRPLMASSIYSPPQPAAQTIEHHSTYNLEVPVQSQHPSHTSRTNEVLTHAGNTSASSTSPFSDSFALPPNAGAEVRWSHLQRDDTQPDTGNVALEGGPLQSGPGFLYQFEQQEHRADPETIETSPLTESQSPPAASIPLSSVFMSPEPNITSTLLPKTGLMSSPQKTQTTLPLRQHNQDPPQPSSRTLPPAPLASSPPPPRASLDLPRGSFASGEHIPRAKTASPGANNYVNSVTPHRYSRGNPLRPKSASLTSTDKITPLEAPSNVAYDGHTLLGGRVTNASGVERTSSPHSYSTRSSDSHQNARPQVPSYLPPVSESPYTPLALDQEPTSAPGDPYTPQHNHLQLRSSQSFGPYEPSSYGHSADLSVPQEVVIKPTISAYAPSPSLVGANDPLGRISVRVPVVSFGFGGKFVTCFHNEGALSTGFDVALSSRTSTKVVIQDWKKLVPEAALDFSSIFPGPLHADPGPPGIGIMKATTTTQAKTKKTQLAKYLTDRAEEISQGLGYLHSGSVEKRTAEGKLVLMKLLKIMVENDGRLLGTPQLDSAVRVALVPRLDGLLSTSVSDAGSTFTTTDARGILSESMSFGSLAATSHDTPISVTTLRAAALDKIEDFLLRGERRQAYHYALDEKLWGHAMIIASSIDKEAWKEVVNEFLATELAAKGGAGFLVPGRNEAQVSVVNGREGLRVAYSLFSGQGATAVQELVPKNILTRTGGQLSLPAHTIPTSLLGQPTPRTPNFTVPTAGTKIPAESLSKWAETAAMMISLPLTNDAYGALTALGDQLMTNGWLEAAHACYLLSLQTSPLGGVGNPAARIILLGSKSPSTLPTFSKEPDSIILTEILEYALASVPVPKGQEPNHGIPYLQAYRLIRAFAAAEAGDVQIATRYCEAITACLVRGSPYFTSTMLEQLRGLIDRLSGVSHSDKQSSWMAGRISKPSLDTIGGWLEGRFTKLVTGESDSPSSPKDDDKKSDTQTFSGPFAHYNTISSATSSARSSPQPAFVTPAYALPQRTGSAMSNRALYGYPVDRVPSSTESVRRKTSPAPQVTPSSAAPIQTQMANDYDSYSNGSIPGSELQTPKPPHSDDTKEDSAGQGATWWGSSGHGDIGKTPTAAHFERVEDTNGSANSSGFFSPMTFGMSTQAPVASKLDNRSSHEDEEDDLGLGNNANKRKEQAEGEGDKEPTNGSVAKEEAKKPESQPAAASGSWFGRWWKRGENPPGPVKASLGEESSFYYDKDLKRWVNKKAGTEEAKPSAPPPPPRAQTASPVMTGPKPPGPNANGTANGLGLRPASAIDLTSSPPTNKPVMRVRSNLAPPGLDSAPPTPTGTRMGQTEPPSRPRSQASQKRNIRSRYVDVFAQEGVNGGA